MWRGLVSRRSFVPSGWYKLGDTKVYEPQIRARLGTTAHLVRAGQLSSKSLPRPPPRSALLAANVNLLG